MRSFLGVPVLVRDAVFGNLYLCDKQGADEFTEEDERLAIALATAAGVAIENARLMQRTEEVAVSKTASGSPATFTTRSSSASSRQVWRSR